MLEIKHPSSFCEGKGLSRLRARRSDLCIIFDVQPSHYSHIKPLIQLSIYIPNITIKYQFKRSYYNIHISKQRCSLKCCLAIFEDPMIIGLKLL